MYFHQLNCSGEERCPCEGNGLMTESRGCEGREGFGGIAPVAVAPVLIEIYLNEFAKTDLMGHKY